MVFKRRRFKRRRFTRKRFRRSRYAAKAKKIGKRILFRAKRRLVELKYAGATSSGVNLWTPAGAPYGYILHQPTAGLRRYERIGNITQVKYIYARINIEPITNIAVVDENWIRYDFFLCLIKEPDTTLTVAQHLARQFVNTTTQPPWLWTINPDYSTNYRLLKRKYRMIVPKYTRVDDSVNVNVYQDYHTPWRPMMVKFYKKFGRLGIQVEQVTDATTILKNMITIFVAVTSASGNNVLYSVQHDIFSVSRFTDS